MHIVAFLTDAREINKIMKSLAVPCQEPPYKLLCSKQDNGLLSA